MSGGTIEFRRARRDEAMLLTALARAAKAGWGYPAALTEAWAATLTVTPSLIERDAFHAAVRGGEAIGFYAIVRKEGRWLLDHFWVSPHCQTQGVGRAMFAHALECGRSLGAGRIVIEADPNAAGFYARMGAREVGSIPAPIEGDAARRLPVFEMPTRTRVRARAAPPAGRRAMRGAPGTTTRSRRPAR